VLLTAITAHNIGVYQEDRLDAGANNRTVNMEIGTLRMILKSAKLWSALEDDVTMLTEDENIGKALTPDGESRLFETLAVRPSVAATFPSIPGFSPDL
jgi:hypothetical protein